MHISTGWKVAGIAALGIGASALLAACAGRGGSSPSDGPMGELTKDLMDRLSPNQRGVLDLATQSKHEVREGNAVRGVYDGTRLLQAADAHAYGTPAILDATKDVKGDGKASFNEVRQVVRHFDADANLTWDLDEVRAFEAEVGIRWIPS